MGGVFKLILNFHACILGEWFSILTNFRESLDVQVTVLKMLV